MNNSLQIMNEFNKALEDIESINVEVAAIKNNIDTKIDIINTYNLYTANQLENLKLSNIGLNSDRIIFARNKDKIVGGNYNIYGQTIHAQFAKMPANVFNFVLETGPLYKDNAIVEFYNRSEDGTLEDKDYKYYYSNILKHESDTSKNDVFKTFEKDTITMAVQVNIGNLSGGTTFNIIELCPYLPGSFNIEAIRIFTIDQYSSQNLTVPDYDYTTKYNNVGIVRISLPEKIAMYRIEFDIKLKYQMNGYPFGLRHLYFYEADMNTEDDYIVVEVDKKDFISSVGPNILIMTPSENIESTADKYGIEYFMFYNNDTLQVPLSNPISRNITKFYAKIPLKEPLIGIEFKDIQTR